MKNGKFVISLDFELHWGAPELWNLSNKKDYFDATRKSIPDVLSLFERFGIHATWATVGFLFARNKKQLLELLPVNRPTYENETLNYYKLINNNEIGMDENDDPYHYGYSLIKKITETPNQELASHTFCHYYCNEPGQNLMQFDEDLKAAQQISSENFGVKLKSLIFPRNQFNESYIEVAKKNGIKVVRSNPDVWFWKNNNKLSPLARAFDTLLPISKPMIFDENNLIVINDVLLLPASRFLRPFSKQEKFIQVVKSKRIKDEMTYAAKNNMVYHLWWHPHNFGNDVEENLLYLKSILKHFKKLNESYGFESKSMINFNE